MPNDLTILAKHRDALLLAEVAAWLHDMGKCADEHIEKQASDAPEGLPYAYKKDQVSRVEADAKLTLLGEAVPIRGLIETGTPTSMRKPDTLWLVRALGRCHNAAHVEKEDSPSEGKQPKEDTRLSTAFGVEDDPVTGLTAALGTLPLDPLAPRQVLEPKVRDVFSRALGETRRPINEVTLWDWSSLVAALYKAAVAGALLGHKPEPQDLRWRLLCIRVNRLAFLSNVTRIPDLLARQQLLDDAFERVRRLLEEDLPLATRAYAGANDHVYVVPDIDDLLDSTDGQKKTLRTLLETAFAQGTASDDTSLALSGEVVPKLDLDKEGWKAQLPDRTYDVPPIGAILSSPVAAYPDPSAVASAWSGSGREVCPVCGLRSKAEKEDTCGICRQRRQSRIEAWESREASTIWLDEIADHKDIVALIVGRFDLDGWLSGALVKTMLVNKPETGDKAVAKNPSLARLRRIWETTERFWTWTSDQILKQHSYGQRVKGAEARNARRYVAPDKIDGWRAGVPYDGTVDGQTISLLWRPDEQRFITISNLQLGDPQVNETVEVTDPDRPDTRTTFRVASATQIDGPMGSYSPYLTLLASPDQFIALVPGHDAFALLSKMGQAYQQEFGKVRNRLPLSLGVIFFQRKLPLMAALDAGRRMLTYPGRPADERWRVKDVATEGTACVVHLEGGEDGGALTWRVPVKMGDGKTDDEWYPYVFVATDGDDSKVATRTRKFKGPRPGAAESCWLVHVGDLRKGDQVYFTPATLDVEWLDAAARRFEIAYDTDGRRLRMPRRPYLLDDLPHFQTLAGVLGVGLSASQRHALRDAIEGKRKAWQPQGEELQKGGAFWQFCRDAIVTADWRGKPQIDYDEWADHATRGTLTDIINLYARLDLFEGAGAADASKETKGVSDA